MISEDITLDSRVHARIIGARGRGIRKIMDEFKVRAGSSSNLQYSILMYIGKIHLQLVTMQWSNSIPVP